ncbi:MAG: hypothetical protein GX845_01635 [Erysipelothrix sp.]|nr:hypothetical protein [Erysipelothrix sp.]
MISWIKSKLKPYYSVPDAHLIDQVILLLESQMPFDVIVKTCQLKQTSLNQFTQHVYHKKQATYNNLKNNFSQLELLVLHRKLNQFQTKIKRHVIKLSLYPLLMMVLSYMVFLLFYFVIYPLFLSINQASAQGFYQGYVVLSFIMIIVIILGALILKHVYSSSYQSTLLLRAMLKKYPNFVLFDYYSIQFILIYALCLDHNYSSIMTLALLRGYLKTPFLKAIAFDVARSCEKGNPLHDAIKEQNLSMLLNQGIELGMAANDLQSHINTLAETYPKFFLNKLKKNLYKVNMMFYMIVLVHCYLIVSILQIPTKMMSELF